MRYGLTFYGPFNDNHVMREATAGRLKTVFYGVTDGQCETVWSTLQNFPHFNQVDVIMRHGGDLVVHVYYSPVNVPEDADCAFHSKISPRGTYC